MTTPTVLLAQKGDAAAWAELYRLVTPKLLVYLKSKPSYETSESEEDFIADAWVLAATQIHEFEGDERAFTAWIFTIALNKLSNSNRKAHRRKTDSTESFELLDRENWEQNWLATEELLSLLDERERALVVLVDLLGFTNVEAGKMQKLSTANVRIIRFKALRRLRATLKENQSY